MFLTVWTKRLAGQLLTVCLADNGSEFSNPKVLEFDAQGTQRTRVFYCDPYVSYQKPNVELNHEFIRKILPKGTSLDHLCQTDINLMMPHINSYSREKLGDKSPFDVFSFIYGNDILEKLGIRGTHALCPKKRFLGIPLSVCPFLGRYRQVYALFNINRPL